MRVQVSNMLPPGEVVPKRVHKRRRSQSAAYHARVQKKWAKRFGTKTERTSFVMGDTLFVDQETYKAMLEAIPAQEQPCQN